LMILREPCLPPGWYPREKGKIEEFLKPFSMNRPSPSAAVVAPHAGWYYSGTTAALAVSSLDPEAETVAVIGGHLGRGMSMLMAAEDGVKTPLGTMKIDKELRDEFAKQLSSRPDRYSDNTVEVLLPMVHYFFPGSQLLWLRFPAELSSFDAGKLLARTASSLRRRVVVLASTDLTHYGANYGYSPRGRGASALEWMKKVNDAAFIKAVLEGGPSQVLARAEEDLSACSAGAVLGALGFVDFNGKGSGSLLDYRTSADVGRSTDETNEAEIPDSFVGYAAISLG
jgi:AmmeMemoRadiSam system protein B